MCLRMLRTLESELTSCLPLCKESLIRIEAIVVVSCVPAGVVSLAKMVCPPELCLCPGSMPPQTPVKDRHTLIYILDLGDRMVYHTIIFRERVVMCDYWIPSHHSHQCSMFCGCTSFSFLRRRFQKIISILMMSLIFSDLSDIAIHW